uniref:ADP,ATP carrier protein n=1 Tax=Fagus sylvatica TaxID=28930 RepID=A0A2N9F5G9_FAGSY
MTIISRSRLDAILSTFVTVHPHETYILLHSFSCFFFILSAYFVVLPLRDDGAISLGLSNLPGLFVGSLVLTLIAAPLSTLIFALPNLSKTKMYIDYVEVDDDYDADSDIWFFLKFQALVLIHRFFSVSLVLFFILWLSSSNGYLPSKLKGSVATSSTSKEEQKVDVNVASSTYSVEWDNQGWFYMLVRVAFFLWVGLLNLITISSTWARVIDVMDSESGSRLFGFIGAGATLGQLFGSLFATGMAWLGPFLLLFAALLMEFAAQSSKGINKDVSHNSHLPEELSPIREADPDQQNEVDGDGQTAQPLKSSSPKSPSSVAKPQLWTILDGLQLILSSTYLLYVSLFLWLSAVVSSFFYFQKVSVIAATVTSSVGRRRLFAQINSFIAVFILAGQLTLTGRILTVAGVTTAICSAPFVAFSNLIAIAVWPTWVAVAVSETLRKVCIDVIVQRLGDATAAGMYKLLFSNLNGRTSTVSLYALPVCILWIVTAFHLGRRQAQLSKLQTLSTSENVVKN